jgi:hypothetical protein
MAAENTMYRVMMEDPSTGNQYELQPDSYEFSEELNKEKIASFSFSFAALEEYAEQNNTDIMSMFTATFREIWIERRDANNVYQKIFWGAITDFSVSPSPDGNFTFTIQATDWFGLLVMRIAGTPSRVFTATDAGEIAWTLIDESQTSDNPYSDFGITEGSITASKNRDRTYRFDNVKDSIIALSNANLKSGFDCEIDNAKDFNVYYPTKGSAVDTVVFDINSVNDFSYRKPLILSLANKVHAVGEGVNDDPAYSTRNGTNANKTNWKLLERKISEPGVTETTTLQDKGDKFLDLYQAPIPEFTAEHYDGIDTSYGWFDYLTGDTIRVNFPNLDMSNAAKRVIRKDFKMYPDVGVAYIKTLFDLGIKL